jgi:Ribosomal proteins 50S-L18Ae/60S-L20/60S-L18A
MSVRVSCSVVCSPAVEHRFHNSLGTLPGPPYLQIFERKPTTVKNYGIWVRYMSRTGFHNMYKEYRDTTLNGAVEQVTFLYFRRVLGTGLWSATR